MYDDTKKNLVYDGKNESECSDKQQLEMTENSIKQDNFSKLNVTCGLLPQMIISLDVLLYLLKWTISHRWKDKK